MRVFQILRHSNLGLPYSFGTHARPDPINDEQTVDDLSMNILSSIGHVAQRRTTHATLRYFSLPINVAACYPFDSAEMCFTRADSTAYLRSTKRPFRHTLSCFVRGSQARSATTRAKMRGTTGAIPRSRMTRSSIGTASRQAAASGNLETLLASADSVAKGG